VLDQSAVRVFLAALSGWFDHQQQDVIAYLIEENRTLRAQLGGRRLRVTDEQRRRLARRGKRLGRHVLSQVATMMTGTLRVRPEGNARDKQRTLLPE